MWLVFAGFPNTFHARDFARSGYQACQAMGSSGFEVTLRGDVELFQNVTLQRRRFSQLSEFRSVRRQRHAVPGQGPRILLV